jgi:hypothetical protein
MSTAKFIPVGASEVLHLLLKDIQTLGSIGQVDFIMPKSKRLQDSAMLTTACLLSLNS